MATQAWEDRQGWFRMGLFEMSSRSELELLPLLSLVQATNHRVDPALHLVYYVQEVRQMVVAWSKARQTH